MAMKRGEVITTGDEDDRILQSSSLCGDGEMEIMNSMDQETEV
jgi:hypothetical protein